MQRDIHTGFPIIQASGLKGAMREVAERKLGKNSDSVEIVFGKDKGSDHAGAMSVTDARLLAFPVRSLSEVYVWVTCPMVLGRLKRDMTLINIPTDSMPDITADIDMAYVSDSSDLKGNIVLEEFCLTIDNKAADITKWLNEIIKLIPSADAHKSIKEKMKKHLVVIHDDDFAHLVKTATQVSARIVLNENKTSENLWYEESLPPDTLFYSMIFTMNSRKDATGMKADEVVKTIKDAICNYIQIGGNETVGMGWCAVTFEEEK